MYTLGEITIIIYNCKTHEEVQKVEDLILKFRAYYSKHQLKCIFDWIDVKLNKIL